MTVPTIRGSVGGTDTSPNADCTFAAITAGDLLVVWMHCDADLTISSPDGETWTKQPASWERHDGAYSFPEPETWCWTATAINSHTAGSYTATATHVGAAARATFVTLVLTPATVDGTDDTGGGSGSTTTSPSIAGHTTTGADRLVVYGIGADRRVIDDPVDVSSWSNGSLSGFAEIDEGSFSGGGAFGKTMAVAAGSLASAGATGSATATLSNASYYSGGSISFADAARRPHVQVYSKLKQAA